LDNFWGEGIMRLKVIMKKNILIGVCGGIASYKTCELVRLLTKAGANVKVMMTEAATKFVSPLVFQELSKNPVYLDMFTLEKVENIKHISLARWADVCIIAPLSANTLSKISLGLCDNLLTTVVCAFPAKTRVIFAPAMNECMWKNPIIQDNTSKLKKNKNYIVLSPEKGELACGVYGEGRMPEPEDILKAIR
jgi:phosphopantothenoylcysteine decarboxylase/phosphopantothenate--cysteine ligase